MPRRAAMDKMETVLKYLPGGHRIMSPIKKRAKLLLLDGSSLQEIFYNLPGANTEPTYDNNVF